MASGDIVLVHSGLGSKSESYGNGLDLELSKYSSNGQLTILSGSWKIVPTDTRDKGFIKLSVQMSWEGAPQYELLYDRSKTYTVTVTED